MEVLGPILIIVIIVSIFFGWLEKKPVKESQDQQPSVVDEAVLGNGFLKISQTLISCLNSHNIKYTVSNEGTLYNMGFRDENTEVEIFTRIEKEGAFVKFSSVLSYEIPDSKMIKVSELVTRLNENFILGHFNLYYDLRLLVYEIVVIMDEIEMTANMLEANIDQCKRIPFKFRPLFNRVIENDEEPLLVVIDFYNQPETNTNSSAE